MEAHLAAAESSDGAASSSASTSTYIPVEDDDVVFVESIQPPVCAPTMPNERNFIFGSSKHENPQGNFSTISPSSRDSTSQTGNICETIVIDDEGDTETNGEKEKNSTSFIEWGPHGNKNSTKNVDFPLASLSRSKTKTAVGPFNPGRIDVTDAFQNGRFAVHHNPDSCISQSASFPRNQKQQGVDSLSPVASLPKQNFQSSNQQHLTKPANKITCANCKNPLQKGQTAYQRKGSAHLFCSTTCLSSFSHKRTRRTRNVMSKKDSPVRTTTTVPPVESSKSSQEFRSASLSPQENCQSLRKEVFTKSRCIICNKLGEDNEGSNRSYKNVWNKWFAHFQVEEPDTRAVLCFTLSLVRHEISVNSITHKLCSNSCFNEYRLTNGLIMNCCEQCSKYIPKSTGHSILVTGQQKKFCCQNCADEYKEIMEAKSKMLFLQSRKRNAIREENGKKLYVSSNTFSGNTGAIPEKKGKNSEMIKVAADCSLDTSSKEQNVNLPCPVAGVSDTFQEQLGDKSSEEFDMSVVLSMDPGSWPRILNTKQREFLVKNDPPQVRNITFPKDSLGKKFSETYYTQILPNGEKTTRSWLLYSASKDSVFCLYCRLFGEGKNQLRNENGCKDWHHLSHILSKHEESEMHINNTVKYSKLKYNLENKTNEDPEGEENGVQLLYT